MFGARFAFTRRLNTCAKVEFVDPARREGIDGHDDRNPFVARASMAV